MKKKHLWFALVIAAVAVAGLYFAFSSEVKEPEPQTNPKNILVSEPELLQHEVLSPVDDSFLEAQGPLAERMTKYCIRADKDGEPVYWVKLQSSGQMFSIPVTNGVIYSVTEGDNFVEQTHISYMVDGEIKEVTQYQLFLVTEPAEIEFDSNNQP